MKKQTLAIVSPVYNEEQGIGDFYRALRAELDTLNNYETSITFVVDRCTDNTLEVLRPISAEDSSVRILVLSSRFGYQKSLLAGIDNTDADVVIMMDSDMQNPPSMIPEFLREYEKGADIVSAVRKDTEGLSGFRKLQSSIFYRFINMISDTPILENSADFRLISRKVAQIVRTDIRERDLFLRGIFSWVGFTHTHIFFVTPQRLTGKTKFSTAHLARLAITGLVSFSKKPLRIAIIAGAFFAMFGFVFILYTLFEYFANGALPPGWATVVILLSIFGSIQLIFLGVLAEYIGVIFDEVKARPHYIIDEIIESSHPERSE